MDANLQQKLEIMNSLHEAGHAVMALLVGAYVVEIQIHSADFVNLIWPLLTVSFGPT